MPPETANPAKLMVVDNSPPSCLWCGAPLPRSRSDRRFCSRSCTMRFAKWRKNLPRLQHQIEHRIKMIAEYSKYPQFVDAAVALSNVSKTLNYYAQLAQQRQQKAMNRMEGDGQ